uniref:Uncharacterized protein n=1 Tax=Lepeophtheirus salmonis TaxID=72036 RepID=A0A0K2VED1_LEPSM
MIPVASLYICKLLPLLFDNFLEANAKGRFIQFSNCAKMAPRPTGEASVDNTNGRDGS